MMYSNVQNIVISGFALFVGLSIGLLGGSVNLGVIVSMGLTAAFLFMLTETTTRALEEAK